MRRRKRRIGDAENPLQKAKYLIGLALDDTSPIEERRTAALTAVKHIDKYDLLARPFEGNKTIQTLLDVGDRLADPELVSGLKNLGVEFLSQTRRRR